jgi:Glycosyl transferase family 2
MPIAPTAVVVDFNVPPNELGNSSTQRVGENFLETCWSVRDLERPIANAGWLRGGQLTLTNVNKEKDVVWILTRSEPTTSDPSEALKVSIIMPTYRRSHTLFRTVQTVRNQTYRNWELIIIDNEGTKEYQFSDPRIRVYTHSNKPSASYARNQGLTYATGDLVCFFDDDDEMFPFYLEMFVRAFEANPTAKMVRCGMIVSGGRTNFSYATPECCLRREFVTPSWTNSNSSHDQHYFKNIINQHGWSDSKGDIITLNETLCRANCDPKGGLRGGRL